MANRNRSTSPLLLGALVLFSTGAVAQFAADSCKPSLIIPLANEQPPAKIIIDPPLAEPRASRGVVIINYCAENLANHHLLDKGTITFVVPGKTVAEQHP